MRTTLHYATIYILQPHHKHTTIMVESHRNHTKAIPKLPYSYTNRPWYIKHYACIISVLHFSVSMLQFFDRPVAIKHIRVKVCV